MVKCAVCGVLFDKDKVKSVKYNGNRYAHYTCAPNKPIYYAGDPKTLEIERITNFMRDLLKENFNKAKTLKQINEFVNDYRMTYPDIYRTLLYWYKVKGNNPDLAQGGIGIVPFVSQEAKRFFNMVNNSKEANKVIPDFDDVQVREVTIKVPTYKSNPIKLFNLESEDK